MRFGGIPFDTIRDQATRDSFRRLLEMMGNMFLVGTAAERPTSARAGTLYYATDTGDLSYYAGSIIGWVAVLEDSGPASHNLLSANHPDVTPASPTRGDITTAQDATPKWGRLAKGAENDVLAMGANEPGWTDDVNLDTGAFNDLHSTRETLGTGNRSHFFSHVQSYSQSAGNTMKLGEVNLGGPSRQVMVRGHVMGSVGTYLAYTDFVLAIRTNTLPSASFAFMQERSKLSRDYNIKPYYLADENSIEVVITATASSSLYTIGWFIEVQERGNYDSYTNESSVAIFDPGGYSQVAESSASKIFSQALYPPSIHLGDNKRLYLGDSDDVSVYFNGTDGVLA